VSGLFKHVRVDKFHKDYLIFVIQIDSNSNSKIAKKIYHKNCDPGVFHILFTRSIKLTLIFKNVILTRIFKIYMKITCPINPGILTPSCQLHPYGLGQSLALRWNWDFLCDGEIFDNEW
jgi:hypothetical protein